ncbi:MAG TPA: 2-phospho-L-lactate transferase [Thermomicrobiales bacterium]|nr:2-phospho-L-lactate transferase [Thermomicrobiales bacterium]
MAEQRIVAIAGGVGGAKLAHGLQLALPNAGALSVIVNTADDFDLYGLRICPDLDTVMYTLAGLANPATGWGIEGDSFATLGMLARYSGEPWFQLGDRDFATHVHRTQQLRSGATLSEVTASMASALGIRAALIPMTDDRVATMIDTPDGRLDFQDYFVARRHGDRVLGVQFDGISLARPCESALRAIAEASAIIFCPSNPIVSLGPVLAVPGMRDAIERSSAPVVAVSPIVGGRALKGPADSMLDSLGHEVSAAGVAALYLGLLDGIVIDEADAALAEQIESSGMRVVVTRTVMQSYEDRAQLARETLGFAATLAATLPAP